MCCRVFVSDNIRGECPVACRVNEKDVCELLKIRENDLLGLGQIITMAYRTTERLAPVMYILLLLLLYL